MNGSVNRHNTISWSSENPRTQIPIPHSLLGVMVWLGVSPTGLIGPHFFDGPVTGESYTQMLQDVLWPAIVHRRRLFQQDGAPAHYSLQARAWLDHNLPGRWIGRRGPIEGPARSPDLAPCDYFLWSCLRQQVYRSSPFTIQQLRASIAAACAQLDSDLCATACRSLPQRLRDCLRLGGSQLFK